MLPIEVNNIRQKSENAIMVIAAARVGTKSPWDKVLDEAARISRILEKKWLQNKSIMDLDAYSIQFIMNNYKTLIDPNYQEDYVVGRDDDRSKSEELTYDLHLKEFSVN